MQEQTYEIRLRSEFENMINLANHIPTQKHIELYYFDRLNLEIKKIDIADRELKLFPEMYKIIYKMPMYISEDKLNIGWQGEVNISLSKAVFEENAVPETRLNAVQIPFNHHIKHDFICSGGIWSVAKSYGVWYYVIGIGALLNQESEWLEHNFEHFSPMAKKFWDKRGRNSISKINWPYNLLTSNQIKIVNQKYNPPKISK